MPTHNQGHANWLAGLRRSIAIAGLLAGSNVLAAETPTAPGQRPNFVLLLIDDGGFTDLGIYGGEAHTPNIDALANRGAVFTNYHTSPLCSPSRAMLLTGVDNHRTGVATIPETLPDDQRGKPGYTLHLEPGVETVATRLKAQGYRTYMTGKWHLGHGAGDLPSDHGFERSIALDASGADNWQQKPYMPYYTSADWFEDGKPATLPKEFYSSAYLIDRMMGYLDQDKARSEPFFAYIAFQALHIPLQAPREFTAHYAGVYDQGWEAMRKARWQRAQDRGLIPSGSALAPMNDKLRPWDSLDADEHAMYAKSMQVHAGMLEAMDHHIGRLVEYLKAHGLYDNTIFLLTSDNGPDPSDPIAQTGFTLWMADNGYDHRLENLGEKGSMVFIGPEWASAAASPGDLFKFHAAEGGVRVPMIAAGPGVLPGQRIASTSFVTDVAPTIFDYSGAPSAGKPGTVPVNGKSLRGVLSGASTSTYAPDTPVGIEVGGNAALFKGDYKLTKNSLPWGDAQWHLFHLSIDPGEASDLREKEPARYAEMLADYESYAKEMGVLKLPDDFNPHRQMVFNATRVQLHRYRWALLAIALTSVYGVVWLRRRRKARAV